MDNLKKLIIVCINLSKTGKVTASINRINHGTVIINTNVCAIIGGILCTEGECHWCDDLRKRCQSRRVF